MTDSRERTARDYLRVFRANRILIVAVTVACAGIAALLTSSQKPMYVAAANVTFQDESLSDAEAGLVNATPQTAAELAAQGATTMLDTDVLTRVQSSLRTQLPVSTLRSMVSTSVDPNSALVVVSASAPHASFAARLANAVARTAVNLQTRAERQRFAATAARVERQYVTEKAQAAGNGTGLALVNLLDRIGTLRTLAANATPASLAVPATIPSSPASPKPLRSTIYGGLVGLILSLGIAFVRDLLDRRLRDSAEIQSTLSLPVVGRVRADAMGNAAYIANGRGPMADQDIESFRILRANLDFVDDDDHPVKSILVTSPLAEEGKSTVAASLAAANAAAGKRTLLVECDLRRPCLSERLSINRSPGLSDYLAGQASPGEVVQVVTLFDAGVMNGHGTESSGSAGPAGSLAVIAAGSHSVRPAELLGSHAFRVFMEEITAAYDTIIIDTPPLLAVSDTIEIVPMADLVLLCIRADQTTRDQARAAKDTLPRRREHTVAAVVTGLKPGREHDYGDYSYAYYGER